MADDSGSGSAPLDGFVEKARAIAEGATLTGSGEVFRPQPSKHGPDCVLGADGGPCPKCTGLQRGHGLSTKHGSYAIVGLQDEARQVADRIREVVPVVSPADEIAIEGLAVVTVRIRRAVAAIQQIDEREGTPLNAYVGEVGLTIERLRTDLRRWLSLSLKYADSLGMTPTSRARLGLDLASTRRALSVVELHAQAAIEGEIIEEEGS